jgi:hypothetical protein
MRRVLVLLAALMGAWSLPAAVLAQDFDRPGRDRDIRVMSAWYGIEGRSCDATRQVRRTCNGRDDCTIRATNRLCGDPAPGVVKVLTVWYRCDGRPREITRWEGSYLGLRCEGRRRF